MKKLAVILVFTLALGFSASPAFAWSNFIIHLAKYACQGQNASFKNGCYAYIEPRVERASRPADALKWCKENRCNNWYRGNTNGKNKCIEGCNYLYNMGN